MNTKSWKDTVAVIQAIAEAIKGLGEVPSGQLYAVVMGKLTLAQYEKVIDILIEANCVKRSNHLLTWIAPK